VKFSTPVSVTTNRVFEAQIDVLLGHTELWIDREDLTWLEHLRVSAAELVQWKVGLVVLGARRALPSSCAIAIAIETTGLACVVRSLGMPGMIPLLPSTILTPPLEYAHGRARVLPL
jgi:hypothetical protein